MVFPAPAGTGHSEKYGLETEGSEGIQIGESGGLPTLHLPGHLPNTVGGFPRPVHPWVSGGARDCSATQRLCSNRKAYNPGSHRTRSKCSGVGEIAGTMTKMRLKARSLQPLYPNDSQRDEWSGRVDLNHRPPGPEPGALTRLSHAPDALILRLGERGRKRIENQGLSGGARRHSAGERVAQREVLVVARIQTEGGQRIDTLGDRPAERCDAAQRRRLRAIDLERGPEVADLAPVRRAETFRGAADKAGWDGRCRHDLQFSPRPVRAAGGRASGLRP